MGVVETNKDGRIWDVVHGGVVPPSLIRKSGRFQHAPSSSGVLPCQNTRFKHIAVSMAIRRGVAMRDAWRFGEIGAFSILGPFRKTKTV